MRISANGARWRWPRMVFCLLFALSTFLAMSHSIPAQVHATVVQVASTSDQVDPCDDGHGIADHHCHATNAACSLCAPVDAAAVSLDRASMPRPVTVEQVAPGTVATPLFRPPKLLIQV